MKTTIDRAGRVVIPKPIRDDLGLTGGEEIEISARDGQVVIEPAPTHIRLRKKKGVLVAEPDRELPTLTTEQVRETLERVRR